MEQRISDCIITALNEEIFDYIDSWFEKETDEAYKNLPVCVWNKEEIDNELPF